MGAHTYAQQQQLRKLRLQVKEYKDPNFADNAAALNVSIESTLPAFHRGQCAVEATSPSPPAPSAKIPAVSANAAPGESARGSEIGSAAVVKQASGATAPNAAAAGPAKTSSVGKAKTANATPELSATS